MTVQQVHSKIQHLTREDVDHLVGHLEDATISAILATGATYAEIEQALKWAGVGPEDPRWNAHGLTPTAELIYDILVDDAAFSSDEDQGTLRD